VGRRRPAKTNQLAPFTPAHEPAPIPNDQSEQRMIDLDTKVEPSLLGKDATPTR
jgi:hypothetical protein